MRALQLIFFASLVSYSWCGLILYNIRESLHSKLFGHGLDGKTNQNSPITNIYNQQQISQMSTNHHLQNGQRGDYGHNGKNNGYSMDTSYFDSHHHSAGGFRGDLDSGMSSHQIMKQESSKRRDDPKFGYHHDNNIFGNTQGRALYANSSSSSASSSVSTSSSEVVGVSTSAGSNSSSSSRNSSSSRSNMVGGASLRPWNHRY